MSDEKDDDKKDKKKNGDTREKSAPEPQPKNPEFFDWLESHFSGKARFPERIELRVVTGRSLERMGPRIKIQEYNASSEKPSKEKLVRFSNEMLLLAQRDCDVQGRKTAYSVQVWNLTTDDQPLERWIIRCSPTGMYKNAGDAGENGAATARDEDDEQQVTQERLYSMQILKHQEEMFSLFGQGMGGMLDRGDRALERAYARIGYLERRNSELLEQLERALSLEIEREEKRNWMKMKNEIVKEGFTMGKNLMPIIVPALVGKKDGTADTIQPSSESMTLKNFFDSLTPDQVNAIAGIYENKEPYQLLKPGVLLPEQAKLLYDIALCKVLADEVDQLMPGGDMAITSEQVMALSSQCGLTMTQLAPLHLLFEVRQNKRRP